MDPSVRARCSQQEEVSPKVPQGARREQDTRRQSHRRLAIGPYSGPRPLPALSNILRGTISACPVCARGGAKGNTTRCNSVVVIHLATQAVDECLASPLNPERAVPMAQCIESEPPPAPERASHVGVKGTQLTRDPTWSKQRCLHYVESPAAQGLAIGHESPSSE